MLGAPVDPLAQSSKQMLNRAPPCHTHGPQYARPQLAHTLMPQTWFRQRLVMTAFHTMMRLGPHGCVGQALRGAPWLEGARRCALVPRPVGMRRSWVFQSLAPWASAVLYPLVALRADWWTRLDAYVNIITGNTLDVPNKQTQNAKTQTLK